MVTHTRNGSNSLAKRDESLRMRSPNDFLSVVRNPLRLRAGYNSTESTETIGSSPKLARSTSLVTFFERERLVLLLVSLFRCMYIYVCVC